MPSPLGDKIRARRTALGMSLDQLANATGSSKGYVWELENRDKTNPSADKILKIAAALGVTAEFLLGPEPELTPGSGVLDQAFFRRYQDLDPKKKEQLRKVMDIWDDET